MSSPTHQSAADRLAMPMFLLTLVFVGLIAGLIVTWFDIPRLSELHAVEQQVEGSSAEIDGAVKSVEFGIGSLALVFATTLLLIWPIYIAEFLYLHAAAVGKWINRQGRFPLSPFLVCVIPPLRLGLLSQAKAGQLWLPGFGWRSPGQDLIRDIESKISKPMLVIAFLILPVLLLEYAFDDFLLKHRWLLAVLHICTGFIWWCFACEFIVMVSATKRKFEYVKKNWLDLAIILLPLISFLRSIRVLRLAKFARVQQVTKVTRMYRMRGLFYKALRGLLLTKFIRRLMRVSPEKAIEKLQRQRVAKQLELDDLEKRIVQLKTEIQ